VRLVTQDRRGAAITDTWSWRATAKRMNPLEIFFLLFLVRFPAPDMMNFFSVSKVPRIFLQPSLFIDRWCVGRVGAARVMYMRDLVGRLRGGFPGG